MQFHKRPRRRNQRQQEPTVGRIPRVTRLLALAHKIDGMIRTGEIKDWAEAARLVGVTRARMTQIANLFLLAPDVQESVLCSPPDCRRQSQVTERALREIVALVNWSEQRIPCEAAKWSPSFPSDGCRTYQTRGQPKRIATGELGTTGR